MGKSMQKIWFRVQLMQTDCPQKFLMTLDILPMLIINLTGYMRQTLVPVSNEVTDRLKNPDWFNSVLRFNSV
jgi:hypothetical protein